MDKIRKSDFILYFPLGRAKYTDRAAFYTGNIVHALTESLGVLYILENGTISKPRLGASLLHTQIHDIN
jgi:hypothetical protein